MHIAPIAAIAGRPRQDAVPSSSGVIAIAAIRALGNTGIRFPDEHPGL